jgi:hypothetical protein
MEQIIHMVMHIVLMFSWRAFSYSVAFVLALPVMRKVVLIFPDVISITDFILTYKVSKIIVDSSQKLLKGTISEAHLAIACKQFGARIKESIVVKHFGN